MSDQPLEDQVQHRIEKSLSWIVLNRPEVGNALTPGQRDRIIGLLQQASADLGVRAVIITATGKHFCTGADLRADRPAAAAKPDGAPDRPVGMAARMIATGAQQLFTAIQDCEKPVLAAVNGTAAGIGAHIAFASDLVIASAEARFIEVFARRGIVPDGGGCYILPRLIGLQKAKELIFFGDDVSAVDAERLGLVNLVVPGAELEATAREWGERLAGGPTVAISLAKALLNRSLDTDRRALFREEAMAQEMAMGSHDAQEGVASFVERRPTEFTGW